MSIAIEVELTNPFPGLRPFRNGEEHLFFGRERQVDAMIDKLSSSHFLAVVGTSGSGKSSLVNCGLRPALHRGLMSKAGSSWRMAQFRPGSGPLKSMAQALAGEGVLFSGFESGALALEDMIEATLRMSRLGLVDICEQAQLDEHTNVLVIADQFEELFRYRSLHPLAAAQGPDRTQEAIALVNLLLEAKVQAGLPIYVVLTMRSDFLGDCAEFPGLPEAINEGQYLVPRMTREERKAAIAGPVRVAGANISPVLLTRLVNDVGDNPDQLSILQHALNRTWARWQSVGQDGGEIGLADYEAIGTMAHALDQHAEKAYAELNSERLRTICEKIFKALTDKATDARGVRRPTPFGVLCALADATPAEVAAVIDVFRKPSRSFLMPPLPEVLEADTVIDISHESLMRVWERLKVWADQEAQSAQVFCRVLETAVLHARGNAGLYRNPDLQLALQWREAEKPTETWAGLHGGDFDVAMGFLAESEAQQQEEAREGEERQRRDLEQAQALAAAQEQAHAARRLRRLVGALAVVFLIAVMFAVFAERQRARATAAQRAAETQRLAAFQQKKRADQEATEAKNQQLMADTARAEAERQRKKAERLEQQAREESKKDTRKKYEADSERLAEAAVDNIEKNPELAVFLADQAVQATYLPYQTLTPDADAALRRVVQGLRSQLTILEPSTQAVSSQVIAFGQDGKVLETARVTLSPVGAEVGVSMWDILSGKQVMAPVHLPHKGQGWVQAVAFSPDGRYLATASTDKYVRLWTSSSGSLIKEMAHTAAVITLAFTHDGRYLVTGTDKAACVWDTTTGVQIASLAHEGRVTALALNPNGNWLATISQIAMNQAIGAGELGTVTVWSDFTGQQPKSFRLGRPGESISAISFADERRLAMVTPDKTVRMWDVVPRRQLLQIPSQEPVDIRMLAFSADGKRVATTGIDHRITVWNALTGGKLFAVAGHRSKITDLAFTPDGSLLASAGLDGTVRTWSAVPRNELLDFSAHNDKIYRLAFSPDGRSLATASWDRTAKLWDAATGRPLHTLAGHAAQVMGVAFSPDGTRVATCSVDKTAKMWDASSGKELFTLTGHTDQVMAVAFSPDGRRLATASWDHTVRIWHANSGKPMLILHGHTDHVEDVTFSADGKWLASASSDRTARVWDAITGEERRVISGHLNWVLGVAFSPDSRRLATASADGTIRIWDIPSGRPVMVFPHNGIVRSVAFAPDGRWLASSSEDTTAKIWDASFAEEPLLTFSEHRDKVYGIAFSPEGSRLATAGADHRVLVYAWSGEELMKIAGAGVTRSLTFTECREYKVESEHCEATLKVEKGHNLAGSGDVTGAAAAFRQAKKLDPAGVKFDPEAEANRLGAAYFVTLGDTLLRDGELKNGMAAYRTGIAAYRKVPGLEVQGAMAMNNLCWRASVRGHAAEVMDACESAVKEAEKNSKLQVWDYRDSRGLARALVGNIQGAVEDFQFLVDHTTNLRYKSERQRWIAALQAGQNPFTPDVLKRLYNE